MSWTGPIDLATKVAPGHHVAARRDKTMDPIRDAAVDAFLGALSTCFAHAVGDNPEDAAFVGRLFTMLAVPAPAVPARSGGTRAIQGLDALGHWPAALGGLRDAALPLRRLGHALEEVKPLLAWTRRPHQGPDAARFAAGHAYAYIVGPGGLSHRDDVMVGVTLMAPDIRYPDHSHPPDELYIVLSEGEWRRGDEPWFAPGIGGTVRNAPGIVHAMRSGATPLLSVWALIA